MNNVVYDSDENIINGEKKPVKNHNPNASDDQTDRSKKLPNLFHRG